MAIKFVKVERDCPYNTRINKSDGHARKVFDYSVMDSGEHVATFRPRAGPGRYGLVDLTGVLITGWLGPDPHEGKHRATFHPRARYAAETKDEFYARYTAAKADGAIPTAEQIEQREADQAVEHAVEARRQRIVGAAPELYLQLKGFLTDGGDVDAAKALIERIEGATG